jgi:K+-sensing histidine kinase KdpD
MIAPSQYVDKVRHNILFTNITDEEFDTVKDRLREKRFVASEIVFEDESGGDELYLIADGRVKITKRTRFGEEILLGLLHSGDFFGELELLDERPRSARTTCVDDSVLFALHKSDFQHLLVQSHSFSVNLLQMLSLRLRSVNHTFVKEIEHNTERAITELNRLTQLIDAAKTVNSTLDLDRLLGIILDTALKGVDAESGTLYIVDDVKQELWSKVLKGSELVEIRLPIGKGIAGHVAATGDVANIADAYLDPRFNPEFDRKSGYRTKTILCMPMKNKDDKIVGVFQLLNKRKDQFTYDDESFIDALSIHGAIAIENARLAQEMVQSERLSAVGRMANTIIHDIKNPMGTLRVYAQVLKKKAGNEEAGKLADEMIRQVDRFVNMAQEILDFSRGVSATNIVEVEFSDVMEGVLSFIDKDLAKRNVKLVKNLKFSGKVMMDQDKMVRALYNVVGNAADAMPDGGTLTVNTGSSDGLVKIEFIDTGTGMPPEIKAKIFEPFVTHGKKHGTGLGMSIVKKVIDDHKGRIEIDSEVGKGTIVRLLLPMK